VKLGLNLPWREPFVTADEMSVYGIIYFHPVVHLFYQQVIHVTNGTSFMKKNEPVNK